MALKLGSKEIFVGGYKEYRIDDMINQLQKIKDEHGNLIVIAEEVICDELYGHSLAQADVKYIEVNIDEKYENKVVYISGC